MALIALGLGSNLGNRLNNLREAIFYLKNFLKINALSCVYETEPWGVKDQPYFLNACAVFEADKNLSPFKLLSDIKNIERKIGREKNIRWGARKIDIDILFIENMILHSEKLKIPHENLHNRIFVLAPLSDIAPDWVHPVLKMTARELLKNLKFNFNQEKEPLKIINL